MLEPADVPRPVPGPGQVLVRIEATGVNFIEVYQRTGLYPVALPATPGSEAAGVVDSVGEGVAAFRPASASRPPTSIGAYAEYGLVAADRLVRLPEGVSTRQAAAVLLQGMTAHYLVTATCPLDPGDTCLVHAAAGGTGLLICQVARKRGARVIGTVSTDEKAALALAAGAARGHHLHPRRLRRADEGAHRRRRGAGGLRLGGPHHFPSGVRLPGPARA